MDNNDIFLDFWKNYQWPETTPIYYRLYHDEAGTPLFYSQENLPGTYINVTPQQYQLGKMDVVVKEGVLRDLPPPKPVKLRPSNIGTPCHPKDVTLIVDKSTANIKWSLSHDKD